MSTAAETMELAGAATEAAEGAHGGGGEFDAGGTILHHILDSNVAGIPNEFELPGLPGQHNAIPLPSFEIGGIDMSITKHVVMMWLAFGILLLILGIARSQKSLVPKGLRNALEALIVYMRDEVARRAIHGADADKYVPFLLSTFFFILTCNLIGLVPGMATATGNISVTAGLAIVSMLVIQWGGIRKYGPFRHVMNLVPGGIPGWMVPLMFVLEILAQFIRPFALCIRLFANMMAGHVVILAFVSLIFILGAFVAPVSVLFVFFVNLLELLVAFLQAYIFTMLTAQFIGMSLHPSH